MTEKSLWQRPKQGELRCYIPKRFSFTLMGALGICCSYALRYNLSVTMVAMVNHTRSDLSTNESTIPEECSENLHFSNLSSGNKEYKGEQYNWDSKTQGYIMSAFFYCYFTTVFTGGFLADRFGAKLMFGGGVFLTALLTLLTPVVLRWGTVPFIILRALEGISEIGLIIGFSHIFEWIGAFSGSFSADKLISSRTLTRTNVRKLFNSLTFIGLCIGFIGLTLSGCNRVAAVTVFSFSSYIQGFRYSGFNVMHIEMCPQLAGSLYGIANGIACIAAIIGPIMTGYLTESGDSLKNWNSVFYVEAAVCIFVGAIFAVFASAEKQPWLTKTEISR